MKPITIISGGQTGGDQGGLLGAERLGIGTGGWMPKGFITETGPNPGLAQRYGLKEHRSPLYRPRTWANAKDADGTVWFGTTGSPGFKCTLNGCGHYGKPFRVVTNVYELREFIVRHNIKILNWAGNRESRNPGLRDRTADLIVSAFQELPFD